MTNKINCSYCGFIHDSHVETCIACNSPLAQVEQPALHDARKPLIAPPVRLPVEPAKSSFGNLPAALSVGFMIVLVAGIFYLTRIKPLTMPVEPARSKVVLKTPSPEEVHARDAAYWGVTEPDFDKIISEQQKRWAGENGDSYVYQQERTDYRLVEAPRSSQPAGRYEKEYTPEIMGFCEGRVDDVTLRDYKFFRNEYDEILLYVSLEGDLYRGRADRDAKQCLPPERIGRRFTETQLLWKPAARQWVVPRTDPEHNEKVQQKEREKQLAEEEKFNREQREMEARRARTKEAVRRRRETNRAAQNAPY